MKRLIAFCTAAAVLSALSACRLSPPAPPLTNSISCTVTALTDDAEYRIVVQKDSDELATYRFEYPDSLNGLSYEWIGSDCRVSFGDSVISPPPALSGVADVLHDALSLGEEEYRYLSGAFVGEGKYGQFRLTALTDGNVSDLEAVDVGIRYYFNYAP